MIADNRVNFLVSSFGIWPISALVDLCNTEIVVLFTISPGKMADGKKLRADDVVIFKNEKDMERYTGKLDLVVNTVSASHDLDPYIETLKLDGTMVLVGAPPTRILHRRSPT